MPVIELRISKRNNRHLAGSQLHIRLVICLVHGTVFMDSNFQLLKVLLICLVR